MSAQIDTEVLIIGAGFAGLSVAERLIDTSCMVLDRGEPLDTSVARKLHRPPGRNYDYGDLSPAVEAEARALQSAELRNRVSLPLSGMCSNVYSYMQGGISNWWGGYCKRISAECFEQDGVLAWPIGLAELAPYFTEAERALRVHGDPVQTDATVFGPMPGWELWRSYLGSIFPGAHVTSEAKNISDRSGETGIGLCTGNGHCALCGNDAKARPATTFPRATVFGRTLAHELLFKGRRAVAARCSTDGEEVTISFESVVVAAGGLENVALLRRSRLPPAVPRSFIGRWYQDHTSAEIVVEMPDPVPYRQIGAECHVELPDLSGFYQGLEVKALFLTIPPDDYMTERARKPRTLADALNLDMARNHLGRIYLQIEVPPEWDLRIRTRGEAAYIYTMPYHQHLGVLDLVFLEAQRRLVAKGLRLVEVLPHYRQGFGGHHYSGTTAMSRNADRVVGADHLLIGTDNVYISGASVMPRCGSAGPTLSIVAMGLRLGDILSNQ